MALTLDMDKWRTAIHSSIQFYVGLMTISGVDRPVCIRYVAEDNIQMPFVSGLTYSVIDVALSPTDVYPGLDVTADGDLYAEWATDGSGDAQRYVSRNFGETWTAVPT
jgi:hypothetical protein